MRKLNFILNFFIVILIVVFWYVVWLAFWPVKVADYHTPYKVHPTTVEAGSFITYTADYCKYRNLSATVTRVLLDGTAIYLPETTTNLPTGCNKKDVPVLVPRNTPPGKYHLEITLTYKINSLRDVVTHTITDDFMVTNSCLSEPKTGC